MEAGQLGLVHIYCGAGKGKTTAAIGLITRALGHGYRCLLVQFLKDGTSGELVTLRRLDNLEILAGQITTKFSIAMNNAEKGQTRQLHEDFFRQAVAKVEKGQVDLLVFDEILGAIESGLMPEEELTEFLANRPEGVEVVLTGRHASQNLLAQADYVSRIDSVAHPYDRGILARPGIEY